MMNWEAIAESTGVIAVVLSLMYRAYATQPGAKYYLSHREKIFDPRYWKLFKSTIPGETPVGRKLSKLNLAE